MNCEWVAMTERFNCTSMGPTVSNTAYVHVTQTEYLHRMIKLSTNRTALFGV